MSIEGQGHFFTIYFPGFVCFVLYKATISGERLQDHWSSGLYVSCNGSITSVGEKRERERERERELICLLSFTCNYVVAVRRGFLFFWVLGMGCVIILLHYLSRPYNYFLSIMIY